MPLTTQDENLLERALHLAREAVGLASPNPTVGCVLVRGETILGEGAHLYDARDHAEIAALKQATLSQAALKGMGFSPSIAVSAPAGALAPEGTRGATAYVTLEPCAHHGRTGPCSEALIAAGVKRCVVATIDPNPLVSGAGIAKLRTAGVEVAIADPHSPIAQQARHLNDAFAHFIQHHRPFVTLKAALSVDGKLAPPPSDRHTNTPHWLTGAAARADVQRLRHASDAILTGVNTVLTDNPSLTDRTGLPRRRPLLRVVLDTHLRTPLDSALVSTAENDLLILCSTDPSASRESALLARNVEVARIATDTKGHLSLDAVLQLLAERHILSVLVEAGSALNASFLRSNLVDQLVLYYAERELGLAALPFAQGFDSPYALQQRLTQTTRTAFPSNLTPNAEDVRITGYLHDPWPHLLIPNL
jgi:diaminohydroxyphosphoribosylaminopyrimidine deaminase/5-amino-6-(5-phosphoribosylamino)uracil reductase